MDTTAGVGLCFMMVTFFEKIFEARGIQVILLFYNKKFKTGNYYVIIYP